MPLELGSQEAWKAAVLGTRADDLQWLGTPIECTICPVPKVALACQSS